MIEQRALEHLRTMTNSPATQFHEGQLEAIVELAQNNRQMLVVQKTGWGKSAVYFIATKLLRDKSGGPSIIISPLISLMRNQIQAAKKLGLNIATINSSLSPAERKLNLGIISSGIADSIIITPEMLASKIFVENTLGEVLSKVCLFVVDEAHCISDWGHDFRPDYRRIVRILKLMPRNLPVLATTATANNRVIGDIKAQLGGDILISRGTLSRDAIHLQTLPMMSKEKRLASLVYLLNQIPGTGIIYAKTIRDCELVADWLKSNGISAEAYSGGNKSYNRIELEAALLNNSVKALVATSALGMGFDKPDIRFVIHFQAPGNVVDYYQQVGRAGRQIKDAYGLLMQGAEDQRIQNFFIDNAFPSQDEVDNMLRIIANNDGVEEKHIVPETNLSIPSINKILKFLSSEDPSPIYKDGWKYYRTAIDYKLPINRINRLRAIKEGEWAQLQDYSSYKKCLMQFLTGVLDDPLGGKCGKCENCDPSSALNTATPEDLIDKARNFIAFRYVTIKPKRLFGESRPLALRAFTIYKFPYVSPKLIAEDGLALSRWKDGVWGDVVAKGKAADQFSDELIAPMVQMIQSMPIEIKPRWLTYVPSPRHPTLVKNFAHKLAAALNIFCSDAVTSAQEKAPQKTMENSYRRSENLDGAFAVDQTQVYSDPVFLLDDAVDSGWTFTVVTALLKRANAGKVYPIALTSTSNQG